MKSMKKIALLTITALFLTTAASFAQKKGGRHGGPPHRAHRGKVVVVKRSPFRPKKVVVYHPVWGPKHHIHRRWVFFPKYNLYWDNWRNSNMFWNGTIWLIQTSLMLTWKTGNITN